MNDKTKIKIAAIKFAGCASGGSERYLQTVCAHLPKDRFEVDFYYTNAAPYIGGTFNHPDNEENIKEYLKQNKVNLIAVNVGAKDVSVPTHIWRDTNFFELFDENKYDIILTVKAGHPEFPYTEINNKPFVEIVTLPNMAERKSNIRKVVHISNFQKNTWVAAGGEEGKAVIIPILSDRLDNSVEDLKGLLNLDKETFVFGFHQRVDDGIFSPVSLEAYKNVMNEHTFFLIMGGSDKYKAYAVQNSIKSFAQLPHTADNILKSRFLKTLDVFAHSRQDGETFGLSIAEAMSFGKPVVSHTAPAMGHLETIGQGEKACGKVCSNMNEYVNMLYELMNNKNLYLEYSKKAVQRYEEEFSVEVGMKKFVDIFQEIYDDRQKDNLSDEDFWKTIEQ